MHPSALYLYFLIALTLCSVERLISWKDDISLWTDSVWKNPLAPRAHTSLGFAYWRVDDLSMAEKEFLVALSLNPNYGDAMNNLGAVRMKLGRYTEALDILQKALRLSPENPSIIYNISLCYEYLGQYEKAREGYEKAIALSPCYSQAHAHLGKIYDLQGRKDDALREYSIARRCDPEVKIP